MINNLQKAKVIVELQGGYVDLTHKNFPFISKQIKELYNRNVRLVFIRRDLEILLQKKRLTSIQEAKDTARDLLVAIELWEEIEKEEDKNGSYLPY